LFVSSRIVRQFWLSVDTWTRNWLPISSFRVPPVTSLGVDPELVIGFGVSECGDQRPDVGGLGPVPLFEGLPLMLLPAPPTAGARLGVAGRVSQTVRQSGWVGYTHVENTELLRPDSLPEVSTAVSHTAVSIGSAQ
jgi:hypothetical protein